MGQIRVVTDVPDEVSKIFAGLSTEDWKQSKWTTLTTEKLRQSRADLLLLVGLPDHLPALHLLRQLKDRAMPSKIVAVFPRDLASSDLALVSQVADDFILWPERPEVIHHRITRFLVPIAELKSACDNLALE